MRPALVPILLADPMPWAFKAPYAWDFLRDRARFAGGYKGALANTPNWTASPATHSGGLNTYASTAGGALQAFVSGELRRTDKGVLIEGARTNLCLQSQTFDNASWTKTNCTVTADVAVATDGTTTADTLTDDATNADHKVRQGIAVTSGTAYTLSVYAKANTLNYVWLYVGTPNVGTCFNLAAGTVLGSVGGTPTSSTISALGNGWYRCSITYTAGATSTQNHDIGTSANGTSFNYVGTGQNVYFWGAQLEAASFPSSYIPTTTASATRAADVLTVPVTMASPLTAFAEFAFQGGVTSSTTPASMYSLVAGSADSSNRLILYNPSSADGQIVQVGAATQSQIGAGSSYGSDVVRKVASAVATNDFRFASNGTLGTPDVSGTALSDIVTLRFGSTAGSNALFGYLRRAALWTRALTNAELQSLTT